MLFLKINWGQLLEYPFNAGVWGNTSDWVMILVTGVTAYFLWRTLNTQTKSIDIQNKTLLYQEQITKIEKYKYVESIKPEFELLVTSIKVHERLSAVTRLTMDVSFVSKVNKALDINVVGYSNPYFPISKVFLESDKEYLEKGETFSMLFKEAYGVNFTDDTGTDGYILSIKFDLKYKDIEQNSYSQTISFFTNHENFIRIDHDSIKSTS